MNIIHIAGNLGSDPTTRFTSSGLKVTSFNVAVNTRKGENTITTWYRVTVWGDRFDKMMTYLKKGSSVIVVGELSKPEIYTDKEGRNQISLDITADIIRFSPFGRTDRPAQEGQAQGQSSGGNSGFGERSFSGGQQQGGFSGQQQQQNRQPQPEEDEIPF